MANYIYINKAGAILLKEVKGRGRTRKGSVERPEGSGSYYLLVPEGLTVEAFKEAQKAPQPFQKKTKVLVRLDQDGEEIERRDFNSHERVPNGAVEKPFGSGVYVLKSLVQPIKPTEVVHSPEYEDEDGRPRKFKQKAKHKVDFPVLKRGLFVGGDKDWGWLDGWDDGRNVFWANRCVITTREGIGELLFNGSYPRIEIDFDNGELRIFKHASRDAYGDEPCDGSKVTLSQVFLEAVEGCDLNKNRDLPVKERRARSA